MNVTFFTEKGPAFTAATYDEVLFFCGQRSFDKWKYQYALPGDDRKQLIEETKIHIEAHCDSDESQPSPETIIQNRGAIRLVKDLNILFETAFLQLYFPIPSRSNEHQ